MSDTLWRERTSSVSHVAWPPIGRGPSAALESLARQLEDTQWLAPPAIEAGQFHQLRLLAEHAVRHSPHFARRMAAAGLRPDDLSMPQRLRDVPLLGRRDLQAKVADVNCAEVPDDHAPVTEYRTSGSTGEPVVVKRTRINALFWAAATLREYFWHERDFSLRYSAIRAYLPRYGVSDDWGPPASLLFKTGRSQVINMGADVGQQARWLEEFDPHVLIVYPSLLDGILQYCRKHGTRLPSLRFVRSVGETLADRLRTETRSLFSARVVDNYSSQEVGIIAVQCPDSALYHLVSESLIVEVLDTAGKPCAPGVVGRVVITDLHNFATPLVRYDIGDYAEVGPPCSCGRGLPTLRRVVGRERNLILMPDGTRHWPAVGFAGFRDVAPVIQYQFIQDARESIEVRLVTEAPLTGEQEEALRAIMLEALGFPFTLRFSYFPDRLPGSGGKFEEFVCRVGPGQPLAPMA